MEVDARVSGYGAYVNLAVCFRVRCLNIMHRRLFNQIKT